VSLPAAPGATCTLSGGLSSQAASYPKIINFARLSLEAAGNPAYGIVIESDGRLQMQPMIYANLKPVLGYAERLAAEAAPGASVYIVSRQIAENQRVVYDVADELGRKLHRQFEVIERSLADEDTLL